MLWLLVFAAALAVTLWTVISSTAAKPPATSGASTKAGPEATMTPDAATAAGDAGPETPAEPEGPERDLIAAPADAVAPAAVLWPPPMPLALPAAAETAAAEAPAAEAPAAETPAAPAPPETLAPPVGRAAAPAARSSIAILEDLALDDVLAAAEDRSAPPRHATLKLVTGIAASGLLFAGAVLLIARGIGALFGKLLKGG